VLLVFAFAAAFVLVMDPLKVVVVRRLGLV
jgi:hypothetical protein